MAKKGRENAQNPAADQPQTGSQAAQIDAGAVALRPLGDAEPQIDDQAGPHGEGLPADSEGRPAGELLDDEGGTVDGGLLDGEADQAAEGADGISHGAGSEGTGNVPAPEIEERLPAADAAHEQSTTGNAAEPDEAQIDAGAAFDRGGTALYLEALAGSGSQSQEVKQGEGAENGQGLESGLAAGQTSGAGAEGQGAGAGDTEGVEGGPSPESGGNENHLEDPSLSPIDGIVQAAEEACFAVGDYLVEFWEFDQAQQQRLALLAGRENSRATNAIAALVREIGKERATPAVCGQQLKILKLIDSPELSEVETLIVQTFVNVLAGIDAFEKAEGARLEAAAAKPQERRPIPIEDTTMELVDDTLGTFGGRG